MINNTIYQSQQYSRTTCRNNTVCCYLTDDNTLCYGTILTFFLAQQGQPFCFIEKLHQTNNSSPLMNVRPSRNRDIRILNTQDLVSHQIVHTTSFPTEVIAIPICQIIKKCILIRITGRLIPGYACYLMFV